MPEQTEYLIGQPELSELLMRSLFLKGDLPQYVGAPYAAVLQLADLTAPEYMHLRRWRRFVMRGSIAASPGNFTGVCLGMRDVSPNLRGMMAVIEAVWVRTVTAQAFSFGIEGDVIAQGGVATAGGTAQDDRSGLETAGAVSVYSVGTWTNAGGIVTSGPQFTSGGTNTQLLPIDPSRPFILTNKPLNNTPRSLFWVQPTVVNVGIEVSVFWRERPMLETEL